MSTYHHGNLRAALIDGAIKVIERDGVEGLSLRGLAKTLGVSHAAPTRHFPTKSDLLATIVADSYGALTKAVLADTAGLDHLDHLQRLKVMSHSAVMWALANRARYSVMTNPDVSRFADEALISALKEFAGVLSDATQSAQKEGYRPHMPLHLLVTYGIGATLGVATMLTDELMRDVLGTNALESHVKQMVENIFV